MSAHGGPGPVVKPPGTWSLAPSLSAAPASAKCGEKCRCPREDAVAVLHSSPPTARGGGSFNMPSACLNFRQVSLPLNAAPPPLSESTYSRKLSLANSFSVPLREMEVFSLATLLIQECLSPGLGGIPLKCDHLRREQPISQWEHGAYLS